MQNKIVQLRQLLREKFPGLRMAAEPPPDQSAAVWPSGLPQVDVLLKGGLPRGGITEFVCPQTSSGGATALGAVLRRAFEQNQIVALIDGQDSFDPTAFANELLQRLFWVRCRDTEQALKAADFVVRDSNLPLAALDLALNPIAHLRKIPATTWYRFQRILEQTSTTLLVLSPRPLVSGADARLTLRTRLTLESLDQPADTLLAQLQFDLADLRPARQVETEIAEVG